MIYRVALLQLCSTQEWHHLRLSRYSESKYRVAAGRKEQGQHVNKYISSLRDERTQQVLFVRWDHRTYLNGRWTSYSISFQETRKVGSIRVLLVQHKVMLGTSDCNSQCVERWRQ